jgi:hypothetical protein
MLSIILRLFNMSSHPDEQEEATQDWKMQESLGMINKLDQGLLWAKLPLYTIILLASRQITFVERRKLVWWIVDNEINEMNLSSMAIHCGDLHTVRHGQCTTLFFSSEHSQRAQLHSNWVSRCVTADICLKMLYFYIDHEKQHGYHEQEKKCRWIKLSSHLNPQHYALIL